MKTKIYLLTILLGLGLLLACCSDDNEDPSPNEGGSEEPVTPPEEVLITLRFDKKVTYKDRDGNVVSNKEVEALEFESNAAGQKGIRRWGIRPNESTRVAMVGDSIHTDTMKLYLVVAGETAKQKKELFFKVEAMKGQNDPSRVANVEVLGPNYLEAGATGDSITVVLHYPSEKAYDYVAGVYIDTEKSKVSVIDEGAVFKFSLKYEWEKPQTWSDAVWGEYSQDKHGFIITVLGTFSGWRNPEPMQRSNKQTLSQWITRYGAPTGFTIPNVTGF